MHKTTLKVIILLGIFKIISHKVTSVSYMTSDQAPEEALYIALHGKKVLKATLFWLSFSKRIYKKQ